VGGSGFFSKGGWVGEDIPLTSERPESLDPVKGTTKNHLIPDRSSLGGPELHLTSLFFDDLRETYARAELSTV
jgi:hypothetical protein